MLADGRGEILEMIAAEGCRIVDKPLIDTNFPRGAMIGAVGSRACMPSGSDVIPLVIPSLYLQLLRFDLKLSGCFASLDAGRG